MKNKKPSRTLTTQLQPTDINLQRRTLIAWSTPVLASMSLPIHAQSSPVTEPPVTPPPEDNNVTSICMPISDPGSDPAAGTGASNGFVLTSMGTANGQAYLRIINDSAVNSQCFNMEVRALAGTNAGMSQFMYVCPSDFANRFSDPNVVIISFPFSGDTSDTYGLFNDQGVQLDVKAIGTASYSDANGPTVC